MILTEELSKRFDSFTAVERVSLQVGRGQVLALLGPNGAGKTTTVRMLSSVLRPTSGRAQVAGYDVLTQSEQVRASVGVLTENHGLYHRMPAGEYLDFFGQIYSLSAERRKQRIHSLLEQFGLEQDIRRSVGEFSKGMRQKLALARALLHDPPVLLLDEPTSAMDPESARLVRNAIHTLRSEERAIVICTHNLAEAEELADQIAIIRQGRIIAQGTAAQLKERLLGPPEFEVRLAVSLDSAALRLPIGAVLTMRGDDWIRFKTLEPRWVNPAVTQALVEQGFPVVTLQETPRNLEQVYLQAMSSAGVNTAQTASGEVI
jgi:ABC-2 type transport system ATP-binding protein